jgi:hypothetical protein
MNSEPQNSGNITDEQSVLPFVPRQPPIPPAAPDLSRYEHVANTDDDGQRMAANLAAFAFTALLIIAGVWLAISMADLRKTQDCVLVGRRDCAPINLPPA